MPVAAKRTQVWLTTLGDWSWPGTQAEEMLPPSWVPTRPSVAAMAAPAGAATAAPAAAPRTRRARRLALAGLASALATAAILLALGGQPGLERLLGRAGDGAPVVATFAGGEALSAQIAVPTLLNRSSDGAGSSIDHASYVSPALGRTGAFYVYLPPHFTQTTRRYPVVYLLPGYKQPAGAFLQMGLQRTLDRLIARHAVPSMIAVAIEGGPGARGFEHLGMSQYESYVTEVQGLVDRALPTLADRGSRAIAGDSLGGYGAMSVALDNPYRFGIVESWLAFFNGLGRKLHASRPAIARLGLHAYLYGAAGDRIADPSQNRPFAAALRAAGADARAAVYPGEHDVQTVEAHLVRGLMFAGRSFSSAAR